MKATRMCFFSIGLLFFFILGSNITLSQKQTDLPVSGIWRVRPLGPQKPTEPIQSLPTGVTTTNVRVNQDAQGFLRNQNENAIVVNPKNDENVVAGSNYLDYPATDFRAAYYYSTNGGSNWTEGILPTGGFYDASGDPAVSFDRNGVVYYSHISFDRPFEEFHDNGLFVNRSTDGGVTWLSNPFVLEQNGDGSDPNRTQTYIEDKPYHMCDAVIGSPYQNNVYVSWTRFFYDGSPSQIFLRKLRSGQPSFDSRIQISTNTAGYYVTGSMPVVGPNGFVYVVWFQTNLAFTSGTLWLAKSTNGGASFGTPENIVSGIVPVTTVYHHLRANSYPSIAVNISGADLTGVAYVTWCDRRDGTPDIFYSQSDANVENWSAPALVNEVTTNDQWFPWATVGPNGLLHIIYYDRSADPNNIMADVYVATSGLYYSRTHTKVNSASFNPSLGFPDGSFMGDYSGIAASMTRVFPFWTDTRSTTDQDVYTALLDLETFSATVNQKKEDGTTDVGTLGQWNGDSFNPRFNPGTPRSLTLWTTETLHGDINMYTNQKYHDWSDPPDVKNHHGFLRDSSILS